MWDIVEDNVDGESGLQRNTKQVLVMLPSFEELPVEDEEDGAPLLDNESRSQTLFFKVIIDLQNQFLIFLKEKECEGLGERTVNDIESHDVHTLESLIEIGKARLSIQHKDMDELEEFYLKFNKGQDGGSSSNVNPVLNKRFKEIMEACRMEENRRNTERQGVEEARSRLDDLQETTVLDSVEKTMHLFALSVDVQREMQTSEIDDLKKLASLKRLECKFEENMKDKKAKIDFMMLFKKIWIRNKMLNHDMILLRREY